MTFIPPLAIFGLGHWEILLVLVLILVLFGTRLPGAMKSLGASIREFKKGVKEGSGSPEEDPPARVVDASDRDAGRYAERREHESGRRN
jgi:sec-independent protein translocase protein TatA